MTPGATTQGVGLLMVLAALTWMWGPLVLLVAGVLFMVVPELVGRGKR